MVSIIVCCVGLNESITDTVPQNTTIAHVSTQLKTYTLEAGKYSGVDLWRICFIVWLAGFVFQLFKCFMQFRSLQEIRLHAVEKRLGGLSVHVTSQNTVPFSFAKSIFVPQSCIDTPELDQILAHEKVHKEQWHTVDILLAELCCCFVWYNPLVFQLRKVIRHNLEFLTDAEMLRMGADRQAYQYLLLRFSSAYSLEIGNQLNNNFLKSRIKMINRKHTSPFKTLVYLFFIPLVLCLSFSFKFLSSQDKSTKANTTFSSDTVDLEHIDHIEIHGETGKGDTAYVYYKNRHVEKVFLEDQEENISFHKKYGPVLQQYQVLAESTTNRYESLNSIPEEVSQFTMNDEYIWLALPDGSKEEYRLSDQIQRATFERKYKKRIVKRK
jgi:beta-lactamase regulating signal transducer with metallopeptidase domain